MKRQRSSEPSRRVRPRAYVALASFAFVLLQALSIHARVRARDGLIQRPQFVSKAIAARLRTGVRALEAYLRQVLVLMALEMEPDLVAVARPENLARAKAKLLRVKTYSLRIYAPDTKVAKVDFRYRFSQDHDASPKALDTSGASDATRAPIVVPIGQWLDRLDHLYALAKDPTAKARRLAFTLARSRHGFLMAPDEPPRKLHRWSREACAIYDAMAMQIIVKSRSRPPPLPPPRRGPKPMITAFW